MGRIKVFAQFDYEKLFEFARRAGIEMSFLGGKEAAKIKAAKISGPLIEYRDVRFVQAKSSNGASILLGSRFFSRAYTMLIRPRDLLEKIIGLIEEATKDTRQIDTR